MSLNGVLIEADLRAEILADPAAEEPRLVYADLLLARGDPQGELIQLQCAAERLPWNAPERRALEDRAGDLLFDHEADWTRELRALRGIDTPVIRRGFVEAVTAHPATAAIAEARRIAPLRELTLLLGEDDDPFALPALGRIESLVLENREQLPEQLPDALPGWDLRGLRRLDTGTLSAAAEIVARNPTLGALHALEVSDVRSDGLRALARADQLAHLRELSMFVGEASREAIDEFAAAPIAAAVTMLSMYPWASTTIAAPERLLGPATTDVTISGAFRGAVPMPSSLAAALSTSPRLELLTLVRYAIDAATAPLRLPPSLHRLAMWSSPRWSSAALAGVAHLVELELHEVGLTATGCAALAAAPFASLTRLAIHNDKIGEHGVMELVSPRGLTALHALELHHCAVGAVGLRALARSPLAPRLRELVVEDAALDPAAVDALLAGGDLHALERLELPVAPPSLLDAELPALRALRVSGLDDAGARRLAANPHLPALRHVRVSPRRFLTAAGMGALRDRFRRGVAYW